MSTSSKPKGKSSKKNDVTVVDGKTGEQKYSEYKIDSITTGKNGTEVIVDGKVVDQLPAHTGIKIERNGNHTKVTF